MSEFVDAVFVALNRRAKAIRHAGELSVERVTPFNVENPVDLGRLDVSLRVNRAAVLLQVWPDRWIWLDARCPGPRRNGGWLWSQTLEGRFLGDGPAVLIDMLEATATATFALDRAPELIASLWRGKLATGPRA